MWTSVPKKKKKKKNPGNLILETIVSQGIKCPSYSRVTFKAKMKVGCS